MATVEAPKLMTAPSGPSRAAAAMENVETANTTGSDLLRLVLINPQIIRG